MLTHFSLFTGIGGIDLAAEWAGFTTVGQCEYADYPTKILEKHWPDVPRWRDIRSVTKQSVEEAGINDITLISGGFPCQPFSSAGKRGGKDDDRYLWPEMCRVISELKPTWVLGENVANFVNMELDQTLSDLETAGYEAKPIVLPACAAEAIHLRERVFIVAHTNGKRLQGGQNKKGSNGLWKRREQQLPRLLSAGPGMDIPKLQAYRDNNGIPNRVDRIKCLGNAVVPQQIYPILQAIADIERATPRPPV